MLLENIEKLRQTVKMIQKNPRKAYPRWVFDLESINHELLNIFKEHSRSKGYSGNINEQVQGLENLRRAILKLSLLTSTGGWGLTFSLIGNTIISTVKDLETQIELNSLKNSNSNKGSENIIGRL